MSDNPTLRYSHAVAHILATIEAARDGAATLDDIWEALHVQERYGNDELAIIVAAVFDAGLTIEAPTLTGIDPASILIGGPDATVRLTGANFTPLSVVLFGSDIQPATFINSTTLDVVVSAPPGTTAEVVQVKVATGSLESDVLPFEFTTVPPEALEAPETPEALMGDPRGEDRPNDAP